MSSNINNQKVNKHGKLESTNLTVEEWSQQWDENCIGFHQGTTAEDLIKHEQLLLANKKCRIFIPLCGKTVDLLYLADRGHEVIGLEFTEKAILDFFHKNSLEFKKSLIAPYEVYKAKGKDISLFKGDYFDSNPDVLGSFDAIWDRGSFVAINVIDRLKYAKVIRSLLNKDGKHLLQVLNYDGSRYPGPPHTITNDELESLFDQVDMHGKKLDEYNWDFPLKLFGLDELFVKVFLMSHK